VCILVNLSNCTNNNTHNNLTEFDKFENCYDINAEAVDWLDLWVCTDMAIFDRLLVAIDWGKDNIFNVYNIDSQKFIGSFGSHGKGPGEFAQVPELNSVSYIQNNETIFQIFNTEKNIIQNINLNESLKNSKLAIFLEIKVPDDFVSKKPMYSKESNLYGSNNGQLIRYNTHDHSTTYFGEPIHFDQELSSKFLEIASIMYIELSDDEEHIVGSFNALRRIHIYNIQGDLLKTIKEKGKPFIKTNYEEFYRENPVCYSKSYAHNEKILVLNQNRLIPMTTSGELLLFNLNGQALTKYRLDRWISFGAIDWQSRTFYSFDVQEGITISYYLPDLL
jgi:hypothetical protein